jgi:hypothetical protein
VLDENVRQAVMKISKCSREVRTSNRERDVEESAIAICLLEKWFPPTFMNIVSHLPIHLVEELYMCGPMHTRWMYPMERYMKTLKDYVRTYARPEASIAEGYAMSETLGYCTEYMQQFPGTRRRVWDDKEEQFMNDELVQGKGWPRHMSDQFRAWIHDFVVHNSADFQTWRE